MAYVCISECPFHRITYTFYSLAKNRIRGARAAQWWEHSPPTNVARVQIPASTPYVGWVCCWLSPLLREVSGYYGFPGTTVFPSPQKPTFPNSNSTRNQVDEEPLCGCATCKSLYIYLCIRYLNFVSTKSDRSLTSSVLSSTAFSSLCRNCNSVVAAEKKDSWAFWNWMIRSNMVRSCASIF